MSKLTEIKFNDYVIENDSYFFYEDEAWQITFIDEPDLHKPGCPFWSDKVRIEAKSITGGWSRRVFFEKDLSTKMYLRNEFKSKYGEYII